jgi:hypothetical protein
LLTLLSLREQLKARLSSFENAATSSSDEIANVSFAVPESTSAEFPVHPPSKPQVNVRETRSRRKRNHDEFNEDELSSYGELLALPAKRRRSKDIPVNKDSTIPTPKKSVGRGQKINANSRMVIEIDSSNGPRQPTIHGQDDEAQFNYGEDEGDDDYRPPTTPISATAPSGVDERTDFTPLPEESSLPLTERILHLNKVTEPDYRMLGKDVERGRKRASNGLLFTKDGKVDRRSLRFLRDQENQTPSRCSLAPETPETRSQHVASQQLSDPFELPTLPSIEQFESALKPRSTPYPRSGPMNDLVTPRDQKPFICGSCKKQYTSRAGLKYVISHTSRVSKISADKHDSTKTMRRVMRVGKVKVTSVLKSSLVICAKESSVICRDLIRCNLSRHVLRDLELTKSSTAAMGNSESKLH